MYTDVLVHSPVVDFSPITGFLGLRGTHGPLGNEQYRDDRQRSAHQPLIDQEDDERQ
jgi:nitrogen fixation-related uncharacterized protein